MFRTVALIWIANCVISINCSAQADVMPQSDTTKYWRVQTTDKNEFIGRIITNQDGVLLFKTEKFGTIPIRWIDIKAIEETDPGKTPERSEDVDNFQTTRYLFSPNGFGLKRGEAYYQNVWVLFNQASIGISDHISVGIGTMPIYLFGGSTVPLWVTPKLSLPLSEKVHLGAGVMYVHIWDANWDFDSDGGGVGYGVLTIGSRDKNISFGTGVGFGGDGGRRPVITVATMHRMRRGGYLITESYFFSTSGDPVALISIGGRQILKNVGLDYGGFLPIIQGSRQPFVLPWLGLTVPLGRRQPVD